LTDAIEFRKGTPINKEQREELEKLPLREK
jgi:hypothetical protein